MSPAPRGDRRVWRLLESGAGRPDDNMALDAALWDAVERGAAPPTLRLYGWDPPAVSIGRHQPDPEPAAARALAARGIGWVRRPTGGRAVFHGPREAELTYAIAAPLAAGPLAGGLAHAHAAIHRGILAGLARLGVDARIAARPARGLRPTLRLACFAAAAPGEIEAGGAKLVGSAQRRGRIALLQHGSIPLAGDQSALEAAWPGALGAARSTTVSAAAGRAIGFDEAARAIAAGLAEALGVRLAPVPAAERSAGPRVPATGRA